MTIKSAQKISLVNHLPNLQMTTDAGSVMAPWLQPDRVSYPYRMTLVVSRACNSRCQMCNIWQQDELPQLTIEQLQSIFSENDFWFLRGLTVTGGEPTMRKDLPQVFSTVVDGCPNLENIYMATSALNTKRTLRFVEEMYDIAQAKLSSFNEFQIQISVDGVGDVHDQVRGIDGFFGRLEETLDGLEALKVSHPKLSMRLSTVVLPYNIHDVENIKNYAASRGLPVQFMPVVISGSYYENAHVQERVVEASNRLDTSLNSVNGSSANGSNATAINENGNNADDHGLGDDVAADESQNSTSSSQHSDTNRDVAHFFSELADADYSPMRFHYHDIVRMFEGAQRSRSCMMGFYDFVLEHNADIFACVNCEDYRLGNLLEQSFEDAWFGEEAVSARQQLRTNCCPTCPSPCHYPVVGATEFLQHKVGRIIHKIFSKPS